jgi:N-ethylmaleimide reductase
MGQIRATEKGRYIVALFAPYKLGQIELKNRIVMASMTRGRTTNPGHVPIELQVHYYRQRAGAGLILTEGTWVSRDAIGFINVPGLFTDAQAGGWRRVTDAVHAEGGVIFAQLAHSGAISHPDFFNGELPLAPSAVNPRLRAFTLTGFKDTVTPRAMTLADILQTVGDYRSAAQRAQDAGFDGVELHCATTYLLPQFLNGELNTREDAFGGSPENRCRIVLDILNQLIGVWGPGRVGVKISPTMNQGGFRPNDATVETYDYLVAKLSRLPLSHLQILRASGDLSGTPVEALQDTVGYYRARFDGTVIANFGYDKDSATRLIERGGADLVSFAKPFISNPDLVRRFKRDLPLTPPVVDTFYQGGSEGYVDYAAAA